MTGRREGSGASQPIWVGGGQREVSEGGLVDPGKSRGGEVMDQLTLNLMGTSFTSQPGAYRNLRLVDPCRYSIPSRLVDPTPIAVTLD